MNSKLKKVFSIILITLFLGSYQFTNAISQEDYEEEVVVTIIGSSAYWSINMKGGNITIPELKSVEEDIQGIMDFSLLTIDRTRWNPEFELFLATGYNIIEFEALPDSGIFLKINSDNEQSAQSLADRLSNIFALSFMRYSSVDNTFTFFSNMDFKLIKEKFWEIVPINQGGISRYMSKESFLLEEVPIFGISAKNVDGDFSYSIVIGGLESNVISSSNEFRLTNIMPNINNTKASSSAIRSSIVVNIIGGFITYNNVGEVKNHIENRTAVLSWQLEEEDNFPDIMLDVAQVIPSIVAVREVDRASLNQGDIVSIGIRVKNVGPISSVSLSEIFVNDNWWVNSDVFEFVDGETNRTLGYLAPGAEFTLAYRLRVNTDSSEQIIIPQSSINYIYKIEGGEIKEEVLLNQIFLILNDVKPAISIEALIDSSSPPILGSTIVNLTIKNNGNGVATNLEVEGELRQSLLSGDSWIKSIEISSNDLRDLEETLYWTVSWNEGGENMEARSNSVDIHYYLTGFFIPRFDLIRNIIQNQEGEKIVIIEEVIVINRGSSPLESISIIEELNNGLTFISGNFTFRDEIIKAEYLNLDPGENVTYSYEANLNEPDDNYVIQPAKISVSLRDSIIVHFTEFKILPLGIKIFKNLETTANFAGANISIESRIINMGEIPIFNVELLVEKDPFFELESGKETSSINILNQDEELVLADTATFLEPGKYVSKEATSTFILAGSLISKSSLGKDVEIYEPISAELTYEPKNPIEGQEFIITLKVNNPSNVSVFDINIDPSIPREIQILDGSLRISEDSLNNNTSIIRTARVKVNSPEEVLISQPIIFFTYNDSRFEGTSNSLEINVIDNLLIRYGIPLITIGVIIFITAYFTRKSIIK